MSILRDLLKHLLKKEPLLPKIRKIYDFIFDLVVVCPYYMVVRNACVFSFQGDRFRYFLSPYNFTWENERIIEVPIIQRLVKEGQGRRILEVGNVLSHYFPVHHDVVDKYELTKGVINQDFVDFQPGRTYDLIVSISTFEHIGYEEKPRDPNKVLDALNKVKIILAPGGSAVITVPLGYNPEMDRFLREGKIVFDERYCMKRVSRLNAWVQVDWDSVCNPTYDKPYRFANWLLIGIIKKGPAA